MIDLQKMVILRSKLLVCCRVALLIGYERWGYQHLLTT